MIGSPGNSESAREARVADPTFGYLDFLEDSAIGVTGGYLIVSATGRPLEFHCTAPVVANRAQQILFGPTLRPYLLGEQIGAALVRRAKLAPTVLVIADADQLAAAGGSSAPVVLIERVSPLEPKNESAESSSSHTRAPCPPHQEEEAGIGDWRQLPAIEPVVSTLETDTDALAQYLAQLAGSIDLAEPLDRIRGAIREAQRLGQDEATERHAA